MCKIKTKKNVNNSAKPICLFVTLISHRKNIILNKWLGNAPAQKRHLSQSKHYLLLTNKRKHSSFRSSKVTCGSKSNFLSAREDSMISTHLDGYMVGCTTISSLFSDPLERTTLYGVMQEQNVVLLILLLPIF